MHIKLVCKQQNSENIFNALGALIKGNAVSGSLFIRFSNVFVFPDTEPSIINIQ